MEFVFDASVATRRLGKSLVSTIPPVILILKIHQIKKALIKEKKEEQLPGIRRFGVEAFEHEAHQVIPVIKKQILDQGTKNVRRDGNKPRTDW